MKPSEIAAAMATLAAAYPNWRITEMTSMLYEGLLADVDVDAFASVWASWVLTEKRPPLVAELRDRLADLEHRIPDPDQAWGEVTREMRRVGSYRTPVFTHPAIAEAVQSLGWATLCASTEPAIDRAHFAKAYASAARRAGSERQGEASKLLASRLRDQLTGLAAEVQGRLENPDKRQLSAPGGRRTR